jgi:hypothetical protein
MPRLSSRAPDRLDRTLSACDPASATALHTEEIRIALDGVGIAITDQPRSRAHRRARRWFATPRGLIAVAGALASLAGGVAVAKTVFIPTYTHADAPKWAIPGAGPGDILNVRGTNFRQVAFGLSAEVLYPSGYGSWRDLVVRMTEANDWRVPSGQLRGTFAMSAICAWVIDWRHAMLTGDHARASHDAAVLAGALRWRAVTAWDPHPRVSVPGDMGTTHPSTFGWAIPFISAVRDNDLARVNQLLGHDNQFNGNFMIYTAGYDPALPGAAESWVLRTGSRLGPGSYLRYLASRGLS